MKPTKGHRALTCDRSVVAPDAADLADLVRGAMACGDSSKHSRPEMFGDVMGEEKAREFVFVSFGFGRVRPLAQSGLAYRHGIFSYLIGQQFSPFLLFFSSSTNVI
jgi:hypothetical protein